MSVSYTIETSCAWSPNTAKYVADVKLKIQQDSRGCIPATLRSASKLMRETLNDHWGSHVANGRERTIVLVSESLAELDGMVEESIASIRAQLAAIVEDNKQKTAACQGFGKTVEIHID